MRASTVVTALAATLATAAAIVAPAAAQTACTVRLCEEAGVDAVCDTDGTTCAAFLMTVALGDDDDEDSDADEATDGSTVVVDEDGDVGPLVPSDPDPADDADGDADSAGVTTVVGADEPDATTVVDEDAEEPDVATDPEDAEEPMVSNAAVVIEEVDVADGAGVDAPDADDADEPDAGEDEPADTDGADADDMEDSDDDDDDTADAADAVAAIPDLSPCAVDSAAPTAPCVAGSLCVVTSLTLIDGTGSGTCFALPTPRVRCDTICMSSTAVDGIVCALPGSRAATCGAVRAVDAVMTPTPEATDMTDAEEPVEVMDEVSEDGTKVVTDGDADGDVDTTVTCDPACTDFRVCLQTAVADFRCVRLSGEPGACSAAVCPATSPGAVCIQGGRVIACALFEGDV